MEKINNYLKIIIYDKGGYTLYGDYYFYNGITHENGTTKAGGWGYDKPSTIASDILNRFNFLFNLKRGVKWEGETSAHSNIKNKHIYGLYKDKTFSYGVGLDSTINCLNAFNNIKLKNVYYGRHETSLYLEIINTKEQLKKLYNKNDKMINNKKTTKEQKKQLRATNKKILQVIGE